MKLIPVLLAVRPTFSAMPWTEALFNVALPHKVAHAFAQSDSGSASVVVRGPKMHQLFRHLPHFLKIIVLQ